MSKLADKILHRTRFLHTAGRALRASDLTGEEQHYADGLCSDGELGRSRGLYYLPDFDELVSVDYSFRESQNRLMNVVSSKLRLLNSLPFVKEIALCNTLAFGTPDDNSDIDLFVVLDSRRFYTARFFVSLLFHLGGVRRHGDKVAARFCLSFFVSDSTLEFQDVMIDDDIYFYYWFYHLVFLKGDRDLQSDLLASNPWFDDEDFSFRNLDNLKANWFSKSVEMVFGSMLFTWFESLQRRIQMRRIERKQNELGNPKGVVVKDKFLKFHVVDIREDFKKKFYLRSHRSLTM